MPAGVTAALRLGPGAMAYTRAVAPVRATRWPVPAACRSRRCLRRIPRPNVFVVGDAKCGTTTLYRMLQLAGGVGTSRTRKELHFFSAPELLQKVAGPGDARIPDDIVPDEAAYLAEFAHLPADLAADRRRLAELPAGAGGGRPHRGPSRPTRASSSCCASRRPRSCRSTPTSGPRGARPCPSRRPSPQSEARRAAGWSTMFDYEAGGRYADAVERYLALFGRERVMVVLFEELVGEDPAARQRLEAFLGIRFQEGPAAADEHRRQGEVAGPGGGAGQQGAARRAEAAAAARARTRIGQLVRGAVPVEKPELDPATAAALRRRYAADVARLEALIGRPTGWPAGLIAPCSCRRRCSARGTSAG